MNNTIQISLANLNDLAKLDDVTGKIMVDYYREYYNEEYTQNDTMYDIFNGIVYTAKDENENVIGGIKVTKENEVVKIYELVVLPEYRGNGVGKMLLSRAENGIYSIYSKDMNKNLKRFELYTALESGNVDFYIKHGYHINDIDKETKRVHLIKNAIHFEYLAKKI